MSGVAEPASDSKERSDDQIAAVFKSADDAERMRRGDRPDLCGAAGLLPLADEDPDDAAAAGKSG